MNVELRLLVIAGSVLGMALATPRAEAAAHVAEPAWVQRALGHGWPRPPGVGARPAAVSPMRPMDRFERDVGWPIRAGDGLALASVLADVPQLAWPFGCDVVELESGTSRLLLCWSAPRELSFVDLAEDGPVLPVETLTAENGPEHPHRLVREAIRVVSSRN